ncbi:MAG: hypothetical protein AAFZ15_09550 [Bacteroidota bacterium]
MSNFFLVKSFFILLLFTTACDNSSNEKSPPAAAQTEQQAPAPQEQVSADWPTVIPKGVPPFLFGRLSELKDGSSNEDMTWVARFSGTTPDNVKVYETLLQKNGFDPATIPFGDKGDMIVGERGNLTVTVNHKNGLTTIGVNLKK